MRIRIKHENLPVGNRNDDGAIAAGDEYVTSNYLLERFKITSMSLWRWQRDETLAFPKPFYVRRRRYWKLSEVDAWEAAQTKRDEAA